MTMLPTTLREDSTTVGAYTSRKNLQTKVAMQQINQKKGMERAEINDPS